MTVQRPKTKAASQMHGQYADWPVQKRMTAAIKWVRDGKGSQSEAARRFGVTRTRLNERLQEIVREEARAAEVRNERLRTQVQAAEPIRVQPAEVASEDGPVVELPVPPARVEGSGWIFTERRLPPTLTEFYDYYSGGQVCPDCGVHHETPDFHYQILDLVGDRARRKKLVNCAPYHSKSTLVTLWSTLYALCVDPASRTAVVSAASPLANAFVRQIKAYLTDGDIYDGAAGNLIQDWGPFYNPDKWAENEFIIDGRSGAQKDPSVLALGFGAQVYGRRFDRMIFDDVATLDNHNTPEAIAKLMAKIRQEYSNRVGKNGELIYVGTRVATNDIYSILEDDPEMNVLRFPCILDEHEQRVLWPEHFPFTAAVAMRNSMPTETFQLVYQNIDSMGENASFPQDVVQDARDPNRSIGHFESSWTLVLGVDPAGANTSGGYTAMVVLAVDVESGRRFVVDCVNRKQMKAPDIIDQIIHYANIYPLREVRVEVNGLQSQLFQYNDELRQALTLQGVRLVPHVTHGGRGYGGKWDPQFGVESMAPAWYNRMVSVPWADSACRREFSALETQLVQVPLNLQSKSSPSDLVMALWFAELGCRDAAQRSRMPMFDPKMNVPGRIAKRRRVVDMVSC